MRALHSISVLLTAAVVCASCSKTEPPKTVAYYKEHPAERDARMAVCNNDPGLLKNDPDCVNASMAVISGWGTAKLPPITFAPAASAASR